MSTYQELLKSPLWQKKRLEIMQRDNFTCQCCGDNMNQLQVHHISYNPNSMPWQYGEGDLLTLCDYCHRKYGHLDYNYVYSSICNVMSRYLIKEECVKDILHLLLYHMYVNIEFENKYFENDVRRALFLLQIKDINIETIERLFYDIKDSYKEGCCYSSWAYGCDVHQVLIEKMGEDRAEIVIDAINNILEKYE